MKAFLNSRFSSFTFLNITQFLGALNDNIYKLLIIFFLLDVNTETPKAHILSIAGAIFVIPFLLFSSACGSLADRFSKSKIIVISKLLEVVVMVLGMFSFYFEVTWGAYLTLFLMATQSAIFSPSKYGIVPELVTPEEISQANGLLSSFTYMAIIAGTFLASFITEISNRDFVLASYLCIGIAFVGTLTSLIIPYTLPAGSKKKISPLIISEILNSLKQASEVNYLITAIFGSAYFLFMGAFLQLNMIPYATDILGITDTQGGYIFLLTAIGIGTGSYLSGKLSGRHVEIGIIPFGAFGVATGCFLLDFFSENLYVVLVLAVFTGVMSGIYLVPCDSFIQYASPGDKRGRFVAAGNFLSFCGVLAASGMIYIINDLFALPPDKGFTFIGICTLFIGFLITASIFNPFLRFIGLIISRVLFEIEVVGSDEVPRDEPAVLLCNHTSWYDPILLMGSQRKSIRIVTHFTEHPSKLHEYFFNLLKPVPINEPEPFFYDPLLLEDIRRTLKQGTSVCVFLDHLPDKEMREKALKTFKKLLEGSPFKIVFTKIEKGYPTVKKQLLNRVFDVFRIPAKVTFDCSSGNSQC